MSTPLVLKFMLLFIYAEFKHIEDSIQWNQDFALSACGKLIMRIKINSVGAIALKLSLL